MNDRDQQTFTQRYADLLNEQKDNEIQHQIIASMDRMYSTPRRPATLSWPMLKAQYNQVQVEKQAILSRDLFRPAHRISLRLSIIIIVFLVVLLTIGTVYAQINGLLQDIINLDPGASQLQQSNQLTTTSSSQTVHGFTIKLQKAYADSNRVIVVYTIQNPKNIKDFAASFLYQDTMYYQSSNQKFQALNVSGGIGPFYPGAPTNGTIISFDTSGIEENPGMLHLRYAIEGIAYTLSTNSTDEHIIREPFAFEFSVPFHIGKTFAVGQSQSSQDGTITIDQVRVSPSEVRIYTHTTHWRKGVGYSLTMSTSKNVPGISYLTTGNDTHHYLMDGRADNADGTAFSLLIPADLMNKPDPWTVHLLFSNMQKPGKVIYTMTFRFAVPE